MSARHVLLRPVMALWWRTLQARMRAVPRPADATHVQVLGEASDWILIVGNDIARGWGVRSHDLGLPGQLARALTRLSGHGTDVDVAVADDTAAVANVAARTAGARYDAIVVVIGTVDALHLRSPATWRAAMKRMLDALAPHADAGTRVVITGLRPLTFVSGIDSFLASVASRHTVTLNAVTKELCDAAENLSYVDLPLTTSAAAPGEHRVAMNYRLDAAAIAEHLQLLLHPHETESRPDSDLPNDTAVPQTAVEVARQTAVDLLPALEDELGDEVGGLVAAAKAVYGTSFASFSVVDHDQLHYKVVSGAKPLSIPRGESVCSIAIENDGATIVSDTARDARFRHIRGIRFYAGFPVMSPAGHRIGMLCVVDSEPRNASTFDATMLRELAHLLQKRLWAAEAKKPVDQDTSETIRG